MSFSLTTRLKPKDYRFVTNAINFLEQAVSAASAAAIFLQKLRPKVKPARYLNLSGNKYS